MEKTYLLTETDDRRLISVKRADEMSGIEVGDDVLMKRMREIEIELLSSIQKNSKINSICSYNINNAKIYLLMYDVPYHDDHHDKFHDDSHGDEHEEYNGTGHDKHHNSHHDNFHDNHHDNS